MPPLLNQWNHHRNFQKKIITECRWKKGNLEWRPDLAKREIFPDKETVFVFVFVFVFDSQVSDLQATEFYGIRGDADNGNIIKSSLLLRLKRQFLLSTFSAFGR